MDINCNSLGHKRLLPYNGANIEFLTKNMKLPANRVFDVLSVLGISSDDLISFLVNERIKNRSRSKSEYTHQLYRRVDTEMNPKISV